jgi:hypothetical protein
LAVPGGAAFWPGGAVADEAAAPSASIDAHPATEGFFIASPDGQNHLRVGLDAIYKLEPRTLNGDWQNRDAISGRGSAF